MNITVFLMYLYYTTFRVWLGLGTKISYWVKKPTCLRLWNHSGHS